jgi:hypothetical protein
MKTFYDKVVKLEDSDCWMWIGARSTDYGQLYVDGKVIYAHRLSYILHCDEIPDGMKVLHRCDNRWCVNPAHLFLGTQQDNMNDKVSKNRQAKGITNGNAKLTELDVIEIRRLLAQPITQKSIADKFGVDPKLITLIKRREIWRHLP